MRTRQAISALISTVGKPLREQYDVNEQPIPERQAALLRQLEDAQKRAQGTGKSDPPSDD
jgi:hypothetical protein